jgi:nitrate reductase gamma subunit
MFIEKRKNKRIQNVKGLPDSKIPVSALLGGIIISGFIVEGARIAMTGSPEGSQFAFIGYGISLLMSGYHLNGLYAYLWYLHAIMTAIFIAILPFTGMFHVFTAPLSLLVRGTDGD